MNSRQRVEAALNHHRPDRVPLDLGATPVSGMQVSSVYALRQALGLDRPGTPVKVVEPYQMLGEIAPDLAARLGVDTVNLPGRTNMFGFANEGWKPWRTFDGTPVLVPAGFNTEPDASGDILMYPAGDRSAPASGRMPKGGFYFDSIVRQPPVDEDRLDPRDNLEDFAPLSDLDLAHCERESRRLRDESDRAIVGSVPGTAFGDIALVPGPWMRRPKGIRDVEEWYVSLAARPDYIRAVFEGQCAIALRNLEAYRQAVGDRISVIFMCGTDLGTQNGPFMSAETYRELHKPFHKRLNDWVHAHTKWKTFKHSCGSILPLIPELVEAGFDILNPVQCSAAGMDAAELKRRFGAEVTFWGGGVDTQRTLPFGRPEEVRAQVRERIATFGPGGGFVFNPIHNVQAGTPVANLLAMYETVRES
ncbi:MAG TPA: uroporphyrinogen decarboxylase family protein [Planctomycetota bacterium]|nr:uroporphyrinogen decarboxylase family protein [Planctomycetota bacterium]